MLRVASARELQGASRSLGRAAWGSRFELLQCLELPTERAGPDQETPGPPNRDPDSRSRPNRESGIPCFPAKSGIGDSLPDSRQKIGNRRRFGGSDSRLPSESEH